MMHDYSNYPILDKDDSGCIPIIDHDAKQDYKMNVALYLQAHCKD